VVLGAGGVWVLDITDGALTRVDLRTLKTSEPTRFSGSVFGMAADDAHVWLLEAVGDDVIPTDPEGNEGSPIPVGPDPRGIAAGLGAVWVTDEGGDVYRIDPLTREVTTVHVGGHLRRDRGRRGHRDPVADRRRGLTLPGKLMRKSRALRRRRER
jgi:DNA-binding beta-propeller fold protein YncE